MPRTQHHDSPCLDRQPVNQSQIPFGWLHKPRAHLERPDFSLHFSRTETQSSSLLKFQKPKYKTPPALPKTAPDFGFQISKAPPPRTCSSSEIPHFRFHGAPEHTRDCYQARENREGCQMQKASLTTDPKSHEGFVW